jgi:hypothetical protein
VVEGGESTTTTVALPDRRAVIATAMEAALPLYSPLHEGGTSPYRLSFEPTFGADGTVRLRGNVAVPLILGSTTMNVSYEGSRRREVFER